MSLARRVRKLSEEELRLTVGECATRHCSSLISIHSSNYLVLKQRSIQSSMLSMVTVGDQSQNPFALVGLEEEHFENFVEVTSYTHGSNEVYIRPFAIDVLLAISSKDE